MADGKVQGKTTAEPWLRQSRDTDRSWLGFEAYLSTPRPRTIAAAWRKYCETSPKLDPNNVSAHFFKWSAENNWVERAAAWDAHVWEQNLEARKAAQQAAAARLSEKAVALIDAAIKTALKGNAVAQNQLLDRLAGDGLARSGQSKADSQQGATYTQVNFDLSGASTAELVEIARVLGPMVGPLLGHQP